MYSWLYTHWFQSKLIGWLNFPVTLWLQIWKHHLIEVRPGGWDVFPAVTEFLAGRELFLHLFRVSNFGATIGTCHVTLGVFGRRIQGPDKHNHRLVFWALNWPSNSTLKLNLWKVLKNKIAQKLSDILGSLCQETQRLFSSFTLNFVPSYSAQRFGNRREGIEAEKETSGEQMSSLTAKRWKTLATLALAHGRRE